MRDKLVELLVEAEKIAYELCITRPCSDDCLINGFCTDTVPDKADYLISHGVTLQQWIPVSERLPKNGEIVLGNTRYGMEVLQWDRIANVWLGLSAAHAKQYATHWMPLPEPPKEGE